MSELPLNEAIEIARNESFQKGLEKGREKKSIEIATELVKLNISPKLISQATGLSIKKIQKLI